MKKGNENSVCEKKIKIFESAQAFFSKMQKNQREFSRRIVKFRIFYPHFLRFAL